MNGNSSGATRSDAPSVSGGVIVVGAELFQRQVLDLMVEPAALPLWGRFDVSSAGAAPSALPGGRQIAILVTTTRGLQRLLRQRRRPFLPVLRIMVVVALEDVPALLYRLEREELLESLAGCVTPERMGEIGADALLVAVQGVTVLPPSAVQVLIDEQRHSSRIARLDEEERCLLALLMTGASNAEIAKTAKLPLSRVRNMVRALLSKLGCRSRTAAAILGYRYLEPRPSPKQ